MTFANSLAAFLVGMERYAYFGAGGGWDGDGPNACASWLRHRPEYARPLGAPLGRAVEAGGSGDGGEGRGPVYVRGV